jgi:hypothetical protein
MSAMKKPVIIAALVAGVVIVILAYKAGDVSPMPDPERRKTVEATHTPPSALQTSEKNQGISAIQESVDEMVSKLLPRVEKEFPQHIQAWKNLVNADPGRRVEAVQQVGFEGDSGLLGPILRLLETDPVAEVRAAAAAALDIHGDIPQASAALVRALRDTEQDVRDNALLSLKMHRNDTVESEMRRSLVVEGLAPETRQEIKLFLDRYYVRKDPFKDPLQN